MATATVGTEATQVTQPALAENTTETAWPRNASLALLWRDSPVGAFNLASIALLCSAAAILLALCAWLVVMELKVRRQRGRWRPRVPPRPSRVLLLPPGGADEGYVEPRSIPYSPSAAVTTHANPVSPATRAHSYLLVLTNEPPGPYEEVIFPPRPTSSDGQTGTNAGTSGVYLRPRLITQPATEEGYLPMRRRHLPSVFKVLENGELAIDLRAVCDEYLQMAPETLPPNPKDQPPPTSQMVAAAGKEIGQEKQQEELRTFQAPAQPRTESVHSYETVRPTTASRLRSPTNDIQSRVLPPLPPPHTLQRQGSRPKP